MSVKAFYFDESPYNPGWYLIRIDVTKIPFEMTKGSLNLLPARLLNLSYAQYLRFCRDVLGADVRGKNKYYPVAYFRRNEVLDQFVKLLNARVQFILWEDTHPNYREHEKELQEFDRLRNLRNSKN